jgi:hypothetical protein
MLRAETPDRNPDGRVLPDHPKHPDLPFKAVARIQIPLGPPLKEQISRKVRFSRDRVASYLGRVWDAS